MQGNSGVLRDIFCGQNVAELKQWGCMTEVVELWCVAYVEGTTVKYKVESEREKIFDFLEKCWLRNIYPTLPIYNSEKIETMDLEKSRKILQQLKKKTAILAYKNFPPEKVKILQNFATKVADNSALCILQNYQDNLEGKYDDLQLQAFEGLLDRCRIANNIKEKEFFSMKMWIKRKYEQIDKTATNRNKVYKFYGFAVQKENYKRQYFIDAQKQIVRDHWLEYVNGNVLLSPIVCWTQCANGEEAAQMRKHSAADLQRVFDEDYMDKLNKISPVISKKCWDNSFEKMEYAEGAWQKTINLYKILLNIK